MDQHEPQTRRQQKPLPDTMIDEQTIILRNLAHSLTRMRVDLLKVSYIYSIPD